MDSKTLKLVREWRATLTEKEAALHDLALVELKKRLVTDASDKDSGSYFPERSHAFRNWLKSQSKK